jgi:hypothetical protein
LLYKEINMTKPATTVAYDLSGIGAEHPPAGETEAINKLRALHLGVHQGQATGPAQRGQHPKQHAGVWATFSVGKDIPAAMRVGIFAQPNTYTALIRFSNGGAADDTKPAVHAMAIKVLVPGANALSQQQDFILADHPVFFARDVQHMLEFVDGRVHNTLDLSKYPQLNGFSRVATQSLLSMTYWSQTPYRLGPGAVKYMVRPSESEAGLQIALGSSPDCLREALVEQLTYRKTGARFDCCVIPQMDTGTMPIEDPTVEWVSEPVCLGSISIYPQKFDLPEQMQYFESLSWNPWNALPEHAPLGGINRARKSIYEDSSALRHKTTGMICPVPSGRESF